MSHLPPKAAQALHEPLATWASKAAQLHCLCSLWLHRDYTSPNDVKNLQKVLERVTEAKKEQLSAAPTPREKQEECCSMPAKITGFCGAIK